MSLIERIRGQPSSVYNAVEGSTKDEGNKKVEYDTGQGSR
jgi:hypothetical protein